MASTDDEFIPICPECGSTDIGTDFSNPVVWDFGAPPKKKCRTCGYIAEVFPEIEKKNSSQYKKHKKRSAQNDQHVAQGIDTGTGYQIGLFEGLLGLVLGVAGVILLGFFVSVIVGIVLFVLLGVGVYYQVRSLFQK